MTTGCASATSCTLAELFAGGTIAVNEVAFGGWTLDFEDTAGQGSVDETAIVVSGIDETPIDPTTGQLGLLFTADPALTFGFLEYDFQFTATITSGARTLTDVALNLIDASTGGGDNFIEVNADLIPGGLLSVDTGGPTDSEALPDLVSLELDPDIQMEEEGGASDPSLSQFSFVLQISGQPVDVPAPPALALLLVGLGGIAAHRMRRR
jgi:MYXO-CTERM domain-containing protein